MKKQIKKIRKYKIKHEWRVFAYKYCEDHNATEAYQLIHPNVSADVAKSAASRLLTNVNVQKLVAEIETRIQEKLANKLELNKEWVLSRLKDIADSDPGNYFNAKGMHIYLKDINALTPEQRKSIAAVSETANGVSIKFVDRLAALHDIGEEIGMFKGESTDKTKELLIKIDTCEKK